MNQEIQWKINLFIKFREVIEVNLDQHKLDLNNKKINKLLVLQTMTLKKFKIKKMLYQFLNLIQKEKVFKIKILFQLQDYIILICMISQIEWLNRKKKIQISLLKSLGLELEKQDLKMHQRNNNNSKMMIS